MSSWCQVRSLKESFDLKKNSNNLFQFKYLAYASPVETQRVVIYETDLENNLVQLISAEDEKNENRSVLEQLK